jgi:tellurite methyltransferase
VTASPLADQFGGIDIYLFDQLLKGRIARADRIFDAGCGFGRNLVYLLQSGHDVSAADADPDAVDAVRDLARRLAPHLPADHFRVEPLDRLSFPDGFANVVISSAVLHFARNHAEFAANLRGTWRVLASGGMLFCRLASSIGIESQCHWLDDRSGRARLPDGTTRYLVDAPRLLELTRTLGGQLLDPIKTTVVHDQRAMTTWVVRKN